MSESLTNADAIKLGTMMTDVLSDQASDAGQRMAASLILRYLAGWYEDTRMGSPPVDLGAARPVHTSDGRGAGGPDGDAAR